MADNPKEDVFSALSDIIACDDPEKSRAFLAEAVSCGAGRVDTVATGLIAYAAEGNAPNTVKYFIEQGADVNYHQKLTPEERHPKGSFLQQALYYAAGKSARVLIENGADLEAQDGDGDRPLHYAVKHSTLEIVSLLLEKGADVHAPNNDGETPYMLMIQDPSMKPAVDDYLAAHQAEAVLRRLRQKRRPPPFKGL